MRSQRSGSAPALDSPAHAGTVASKADVIRRQRLGTVTAVEIYDAAGETVALLFGKRKPGEKELESWRELVASLPRL